MDSSQSLSPKPCFNASFFSTFNNSLIQFIATHILKSMTYKTYLTWLSFLLLPILISFIPPSHYYSYNPTLIILQSNKGSYSEHWSPKNRDLFFFSRSTCNCSLLILHSELDELWFLKILILLNVVVPSPYFSWLYSNLIFIRLLSV